MSAIVMIFPGHFFSIVRRCFPKMMRLVSEPRGFILLQKLLLKMSAHRKCAKNYKSMVLAIIFETEMLLP